MTIGEYVEYYKEPTDIEWIGVGEITIPFTLGDTLKIVEISASSGALRVQYEGDVYGYFPKECFKLSGYKFSIGDVVEVIENGSGCSPEEIGEIVTISAIGNYSSRKGYKVDPPIGNTLSGSFNGFIGEDSFRSAETLEQVLKIAIKKYPKGTRYESANPGSQGIHTVRENLFTSKNKIIDGYGGSVYFEGKWATIIDEPVSPSIPTEKTLEEAKRRYPLGTKYMSANPNSKGEWRIEGTLRIVQGERISDNQGGSVFYKGKWAEITNEAPAIKHKFSKGDIVQVVKYRTLKEREFINKHVTIVEEGRCEKGAGYKVYPVISFDPTEFLPEELFSPKVEEKSKVIEDLSVDGKVLKLGDWVIIDNLKKPEGGEFAGKIGHIGEITTISKTHSFYTLTPWCDGGAWNASNLRTIENPIENPKETLIIDYAGLLIGSKSFPAASLSDFSWEIITNKRPKMEQPVIIPVKKL